MDEQELTQRLKLAFAEAWLFEPRNAFGAALKITKGNSQAALAISSNWIHDDEVLAMKAALIVERGEEAFLPSKAEMVHEVIHRARETTYNDEFAKLMKLAADMRGFIEKPGVTVNNNTSVTTNKIMAIPMFVNAQGQKLTDDEWENSLIEQQSQITAES